MEHFIHLTRTARGRTGNEERKGRGFGRCGERGGVCVCVGRGAGGGGGGGGLGGGGPVRVR